MSDLDRVIARIHSDGEFYDSVRRDPQQALAEYDLGDVARAAFADAEVRALWSVMTARPVGEVSWLSVPVGVYTGPAPEPPPPPPAIHAPGGQGPGVPRPTAPRAPAPPRVSGQVAWVHAGTQRPTTD